MSDPGPLVRPIPDGHIVVEAALFSDHHHVLDTHFVIDKRFGFVSQSLHHLSHGEGDKTLAPKLTMSNESRDIAWVARFGELRMGSWPWIL